MCGRVVMDVDGVICGGRKRRVIGGDGWWWVMDVGGCDMWW